ncbi:MAG: formate/nitrite transporter family protein [Clostridia bacterium]|nr:formate/nitrite transporter family protein [Clostridia bacterium]
MSFVKKCISGVMAGWSISIGATAFLVSQNTAVGAIFFCIGILMVANFNAMLVTRVTPLCGYNKAYGVWDIVIAWVTNFIGAFVGAGLLRVSRVWSGVSERVQTIVNTKCDDSFLSLFALGVLCAALVAYGVLAWIKHSDNKVAQMLYLMFFITIFVFCGFDHIVANMVYYALYLLGFGYRSGMVMSLLAVTLGNLVGGYLIGIIQKYFEKK